MKYLYTLVVSLVCFSGCLAEKQEIKKPQDINRSIVKTSQNIPYNQFDTIIKELKEKCSSLDDNSSDENFLSMVKKDKYFKIDFNTNRDFKSHSFKLTKETKKKLQCIIPIISSDSSLIVQIIGHSNDSISSTHNQYLSNNRAIVTAELFYEAGVVSDILAKGCPSEKQMLNNLVEDELFIDSSISIYLYHTKNDIKNPCR